MALSVLWLGLELEQGRLPDEGFATHWGRKPESAARAVPPPPTRHRQTDLDAPFTRPGPNGRLDAPAMPGGQ